MAKFEHHIHEDKTDEWATPNSFVRPLSDAVGGFDLDPASGAEPEPHADTTYTKEDDGLEQEWFGNVFLNPPFSNKERWLEKTLQETNSGNADLVVTVLPVDTSTRWFHNYVTDAICHSFIGPGRQDFDRRGKATGSGNPSFAVMVVVFGDRVPKELLGCLNRKGVVFYNRSLYKESHQARFG